MNKHREIPLDITGVKLHLHLSYERFFGDYHPFRDGKVYIATYSFEHKFFDFWSKLEPLSTIYVATKYREAAKSLLRRFPLFEVYEVPRLHTKAVFFTGSGRLLIGSENLYAPRSEFAEALVEFTVPVEHRPSIVQHVFRDLRGSILTPRFSAADIRLHTTHPLYGYAYLPCQDEVEYWALVARVVDITPEGIGPPAHEETFPGFIYHVAEYELGGKKHWLAFDRGYAYCGDLEIDARDWLITHCTIVDEMAPVVWSSAQDLCETSPLKDYFMRYHPIASRCRASRGWFFGRAKDPRAHQERFRTARVHDITAKKIRDIEDGQGENT